MDIIPLFIFSIALTATNIFYNFFGRNYGLDAPSSRKKHKNKIPQIGGIVFGPLFLTLGYFFNLLPDWYIFCGLATIFLGTVDDNKSINWKIKLFFQFIICSYLAFTFWGDVTHINFYISTFKITPVILTLFFFIWFVGIYNSVNLLDGLDGLAGGFMFLLCLGLGLSNNGIFSSSNLLMSYILLGFLILNQRQAKLFMGDAGSLLLGFHIAVLPLLFLVNHKSSILDMTPFILASSFLIADTIRIFLTRIISKKNPMNADTIHFHHLILQNSGSYLFSIGSIYLISMISIVGALLSFSNMISINIMFFHLALILIFVLTPPVQTYVPLVSKIVDPLYKWQKSKKSLIKPLIFRTFYMLILLSLLIISLVGDLNFSLKINFYHIVSLILISFFIFKNKFNKSSIYTLLISIVLIFYEFYKIDNFGILSKLFSIFIFTSYFIFTIQNRKGCDIREFSSLDLLMIVVLLGGFLYYSIIKNLSSLWFFVILSSLWFAISFVLKRVFLYKYD